MAQQKQENMLLNLVLNIVLPTIILMKFSGKEDLGTTWALIIALTFPISYGIYDFFRARKINFFSALGVVSVMLTGGISLLKLDPQYIAIKEAAIPGLLCLATLISLKTPYPFIRTILYNDKIMQIDRVDAALTSQNNHSAFEKALTSASMIIAFSFFVSSVLNYILARIILVSPPGTEAYNAELGKMTALGYIVILVPSTSILFFALYYLYKKITGLTGLKLEEIFQVPEEDEKKTENP